MFLHFMKFSESIANMSPTLTYEEPEKAEAEPTRATKAQANFIVTVV